MKPILPLLAAGLFVVVTPSLSSSASGAEDSQARIQRRVGLPTGRSGRGGNQPEGTGAAQSPGRGDEVRRGCDRQGWQAGRGLGLRPPAHQDRSDVGDEVDRQPGCRAAHRHGQDQVARPAGMGLLSRVEPRPQAKDHHSTFAQPHERPAARRTRFLRAPISSGLPWLPS